MCACVCVKQMVVGIYEQISGLESELSKAVERDPTNVCELNSYIFFHFTAMTPFIAFTLTSFSRMLSYVICANIVIV